MTDVKYRGEELQRLEMWMQKLIRVLNKPIQDATLMLKEFVLSFETEIHKCGYENTNPVQHKVNSIFFIITLFYFS